MLDGNVLERCDAPKRLLVFFCNLFIYKYIVDTTAEEK